MVANHVLGVVQTDQAHSWLGRGWLMQAAFKLARSIVCHGRSPIQQQEHACPAYDYASEKA
jgi:hypothetical protein